MDRLQEAVDKLEEEKLIEITIPNVRDLKRLIQSHRYVTDGSSIRTGYSREQDYQI
jgi:hypothetical protein